MPFQSFFDQGKGVRIKSGLTAHPMQGRLTLISSIFLGSTDMKPKKIYLKRFDWVLDVLYQLVAGVSCCDNNSTDHQQ